MIHFRRAGPEDVPALRSLVESCYRGDSARQGWTHEADLLNDERTSNAEVAHAVAATDMCVLLAEIDGKLAGTVSVTCVGKACAYLGMLCVAPALQAAGLGRALIAQAESVALQQFDAATMEMTVIDARPELIAWYERRGYARTGETRPFPVTYINGVAPPFTMVVLERSLR
ncbi:GNAT family N-acetyltransferase [Novosphingobium sp. SL115]|uniref:GNAT family N-acetyltransferase n=1 Tax=Novosphingobium sp. SL115 TaxID=2995150 RepID=UPI002273DE9D|nr:GNAT family N-acetyltransferase [Novosphingobium sp. SL115]MCY1672451.1 GNAT family N-acetyltransferase [Novosphingobium sp. SL115]